MNKEEKIIYLKNKISKMYKDQDTLKKIVKERNYDKTIIEKLETK